MSTMTQEELDGWTNDPPEKDKLAPAARQLVTFKDFARRGVKPEDLPDLKVRAAYKVFLGKQK